MYKLTGIIIYLSLICCRNNSIHSTIVNKEKNQSSSNHYTDFEINSKCFYDESTKLVFKIFSCEPKCLEVFNKDDKMLFRLENEKFEIISVHREYGERYFLFCKIGKKEYEIWEIELELNRIMQVDLDSNQINQTNILETCNN